jgi:hypothetical protein
MGGKPRAEGRVLTTAAVAANPATISASGIGLL